MNLTILERVQLVKDVVLAICGALTAGIALYGLKTWQRQLAGTTQFELARRALLAVYKVRDALTVARSPAVHPAEYVSRPDREEAGSSRDDKDEQYTYESRLGIVRARWSELDVALLESEVLWGAELQAAAADLRSVTAELGFHIHRYLRSQWDGRYRDSVPELELSKTYDFVFAGHSTFGATDQDAVSIRISNSVIALESVLRRHLPSRPHRKGA